MTRANALWAICLLSAIYTFWSGLWPASLPSGIKGLSVTLLLVAFMLVHGAARYGWRGILVYFAICLVVSNALENLSILTGFPFGHYVYTEKLGPKLFLVPVIIGGAYAGAGYVSWMVAHVLLDRMGPSDRFAAWSLPFVAAALMVAWDLCFDPGSSTVSRSWIWRDGGGYFGVPFQNFAGWYLTVVCFLAPFSWYQAKRPIAEGKSRGFWAQAVVMYFLLGLQYPLLYIGSRETGQVTDPAGQVWNLADIRMTAALIAIFTMIAFSLIAALRLYDRKAP
jgi:putative membrane protein